MEHIVAILGSVCKDGGTCHHRCAEAEGCFRQSCCVPLSISGLDDQWRSPEEAARDEALALAGSCPGAPKAQASARL